jgi:hypothetical protein
MNRRKRLRRMICLCAALLPAVGSWGCALHGLQAVAPPVAVDRSWAACALAPAPSCPRVAAPEYHPSVWVPLAPECLGDVDPAQKAVLPSPGASREISLEPLLVPLESESAEDPGTSDTGNLVPEISDEEAALVVIPEPAFPDASAPTDGQVRQASYVTSETGD